MGEPIRSRKGPNLDRYIRKSKLRRYMTYAIASKFYEIPYYAFVRLIKEANASWPIRKTGIVDLDKLEAYLDKKLAEEEGEENVR